MTRQELMEILADEQIDLAINEAVEYGELTTDERDRILAYLQEDDPEIAEQLFQGVLNDVVSAPVYANDKEAKQEWSQLRKDIAHEVHALNQLAKESEKAIAQFEKTADRLVAQSEKYAETVAKNLGKTDPAEIEQLKQQYAEEAIEGFKKDFGEQLREEQRQYNATVKQIAALELMGAEAKSEKAQAAARISAEAREERREAAALIGKGIINRATAARDVALGFAAHTYNKMDMKLQTKTVAIHPIKDSINKVHLAWAKSHVAEKNELQAKIDKKEQKMLAHANRKIAREFNKEHRMEMLKCWSKGEEIPRPDRITDIEKAKEVLKDRGALASIFARLQKTDEHSLNKLEKARDKAEAKAAHHMEHVAKDLRSRQEQIQTMRQDIDSRYIAGDFGMNVNPVGTMHNNLNERMATTYAHVDKATADWAKEHGMDDVFRER